MNFRFSSGVSRLISLALSFSIALGPTAHGLTIDYNWPVTESFDAVHLRAQEFTTGEVQKDFEKYTLAVEEGRLVARLGDAIHRFTEFDVLSFDAYPNAIVITLRSGQLVGIDRTLFDSVVFRGPVPVLDVGEVNLTPGEDAVIETMFVKAPKVKALYADKDIRLDEDLDRPWEAGHIAVFKRVGNTRTLVDEIDFALMASRFAAQERLLRAWTDNLNAYGRKRVEGEGAARNDWPRPPRARRDATIDRKSALTLQGLSQETLELLTASIEHWEEQGLRKRDRFKIEGEVDVTLPETLKQSLANSHRVLTPRAMITIAAATLGGAALVAAGAHFGFGANFAHTVHLTFNHWAGLVAPVIVDAEYWKLLKKSILWVGLIPPAAMTMYFLADRLYTKYGNTAVTFAAGGMRTVSQLNEPFWRRLASLLRQPHVVRALSLGLNPREVIQPDSALGRLAELDAPTRLGWLDSKHDNARTQRLVRTVAQMHDERSAFARWLAIKVVNDENPLDRETIALLQAANDPAAERALEFTDRMDKRQRLLTDILIKEYTARPPDFDAYHLTPDQEVTEERFAKQQLEAIDARTKKDERIAALKRAGNTFNTNVRRGLYDYARLENDFWRTAVPTKENANENITLGGTEYYWGEFFTDFLSARANMLDPANLVAQAGKFLYTSKQALYGFLDTLRWYAINQPAMLTALYQRAKVFAYKGFDAREYKLEKPAYGGLGVRRSLKYYFSDLFDASEGRYGEIVLNRFMLSQKTIQTTLILTVATRVILGGAGLDASIMTYIIYHFLGHIMFGLWFDAIVPTNARMDKRLAEYTQQTEDAINKIRSGLRMQEPDDWREGLRDSLALFEHPDARHTPESRAVVEKLKGHILGTPTQQHAEQMLFQILAEPPLPGKVPQWIKRAGSGVAVYLSSWAGVLSDVFLFGHKLTWSKVLLATTAGTTAFYVPLWAGVKAWRKSQAKKRHACEEKLLSPELQRAIERTRDRVPTPGAFGAASDLELAF